MSAPSPGERDRKAAPSRRGTEAGERLGVLVALPLIAFMGLAALFYFRLRTGEDPGRIPSVLVGRSAPAFDLPVLALDKPATDEHVTDAQLRQGHVTLVNVFASWCVPCHEEHGYLQKLAADPKLAAKGVRIVGIAYKDAPANARKFLADEGNPYAVIGLDESGRTGIDWGVYGVPETFIVKGDGTIAYKQIGPIDDEAIAKVILPEIAKYAQ